METRLQVKEPAVLAQTFSDFVNKTLRSNSLLRENFQAGRLKDYFRMWQELTSDKSILQTISGFKIPFTKSPVLIFTPKLSIFDVEQTKLITKEITELVQTSVLVKCDRDPGDFTSKIFLRPKGEAGSFKLIFNVKQLNKYIPYHHF